VVTVRWRLRPDGSLEGEPTLDSPQSGPVYQIAAEAAIRAVKACSPFTLPPDRYWAWKSIIWDFDPREML
jgi:colicin import membrane protein